MKGDQFLLWTAGFFDGEGCITPVHSGARFTRAGIEKRPSITLLVEIS